MKQIRERSRFTQKELADKIKSSPVQIYRWESGTSPVSATTLYEIAKALGVEVTALLPSEQDFVKIQEQWQTSITKALAMVLIINQVADEAVHYFGETKTNQDLEIASRRVHIAAEKIINKVESRLSEDVVKRVINKSEQIKAAIEKEMEI